MLPELRQAASRLALNFVRRYKWAFRPKYASASAEVLKEEQEPLRLHFERARDGLAELNRLPAGVAGPWHEDRLQVARSLSSIAGELALAVPATIVGLNDFDAARFDWVQLSCRWIYLGEYFVREFLGHFDYHVSSMTRVDGGMFFFPWQTGVDCNQGHHYHYDLCTFSASQATSNKLY